MAAVAASSMSEHICINRVRGHKEPQEAVQKEPQEAVQKPARLLPATGPPPAATMKIFVWEIGNYIPEKYTT